ncbi:hypothetical protein VL14_11840 [Cytobacillus firmus]|nr:hypothetical protein VL14_11840 [Cytobacillus firmus]
MVQHRTWTQKGNRSSGVGSLIRFGLNIGKPWVAESEVAPGSDSKPENPGCRVRSCTGFRLKTRKTRPQSPKLHRVPTKNQKNQVAESEVAPGSDSKLEKPGRRVRSCTGFRFKTRKTWLQSLKLLQVQTQHWKSLVAESEDTPSLRLK